MTPNSLSKLLTVGFASLGLLMPSVANTAPLVDQSFDDLNNGAINGQSNWTALDTTANISVVVENAGVAQSPDKYLSLVGSNGNSVDLRYREFSTTPSLTDIQNNRLQFYFQPDNAQSGNKTLLYLTLHGNSGAGKIIEGYVDFTNSRIGLTTNAATGSYNTIVNLSSTIETGKWYLFDAVLTPSTSTFNLSVTDVESGDSLLSQQFAFMNTSLTFNHIHGFDFKTNSNGRLDWNIDTFSVTSAIPEPGAMAFLLPIAAGAFALRFRRKR